MQIPRFQADKTMDISAARKLVARASVLALALALAVMPLAAGQQAPDSGGAAPRGDDSSKDARRAEQKRHREQSEALFRQGKWAEAIVEIQAVMEIERQVAGTATPTMVQALRHLAAIHQDAGDMKAACQALREIVATERAIHGDNHWHVTDARWELSYSEAVDRLPAEQRADLDLTPGVKQDSLAILRRKLVLHRRLIGERDPRFAQILSDMAVALRQDGNPVAGRLWAERSLALRRELLGEEHPSTVMSLWILAVLHQDLEVHAEARRLLERALELHMALSDQDPGRTASLVDALAQALENTGDRDGAIKQESRALELMRRALGAEDPATVHLESGLAELLRQKKDHAAARPLLEHAVDYYRKRQQPHPKQPPYDHGTWLGAYCVSLSRLARLREEQGDTESASRLAREAQTLQRPPAGTMSSSMTSNESGQITFILAWLERAQRDGLRREVDRLEASARSLRLEGHPAEAAKVLEEETTVLSRSLGDDADDAVIPLGELVRLHLARADFAKAREAQERRLQILRLLLTEAHWQVADANLALQRIAHLARLEPAARQRLETSEAVRGQALVLTAGGWLEEAVAVYREALAVQREVLGEKDLEVIDRYAELGLAELDAGAPARAVTPLRRALELTRQVRGPRHPAVFLGLARLAAALDAQGDREAARQVLAEAGPLKVAQTSQPEGRTIVRFRRHANSRLAGTTTNEEVLQAARLDRDDGAERDIRAVEILRVVEQRVLGASNGAAINSTVWLVKRQEARNRYQEASDLRRELLSFWLRAFGPRHWRTIDAQADLDHVERLARLGPDDHLALAGATSLEEQFQANRQMSSSSGAIQQLHAILVRERRLFGERDPRCINHLKELGQLLEQQGQFDAAEQALSRVVELRREASGEDHPAYAQALQALASVLLAQGRPGPAEARLRQALEILSGQIGPAHLATLSCLNDWARACRDQGRYEAAGEAFQRVAEAFRQALGAQHPNTLAVRDELAVLCRLQGDFATAARLYEEAPAPIVSAWDSNSVASRRAVRHAALLGRMGQYARAKSLLDRLLQSERNRESIGLGRGFRVGAGASPFGQRGDDIGEGRASPDYAEQLQVLAEVLLEIGDLDRAVRLAQQAFDLTEEILGRDHPAHATRQALLAAVLHARGNSQRAEALATEVQGRLQTALGEVHPDLPPVLATLAAIRLDRGDPDAAIRLLERSLAIRVQVQGQGHPDYARDLNRLAEFYLKRKDLAQASAVLEKAEALAGPLRQVDPTTTAHLLVNRARVRAGMGDRPGARRLYEQSLELLEAQIARNLLGLGERERLVMVAGFRTPFFESLDVLQGDAERDRAAYAHLMVWKGIATATARAEAGARFLRQAGKNAPISLAIQNQKALQRSLITNIYARLAAEPERRQEFLVDAFTRDPNVPLSVLRFYQRTEDVQATLLGGLLDEFGGSEAALGERLGSAPAVPPPTPDQIAAALPGGAILLDFLRYAGGDSPPRYVVFNIGRTTGPTRIDLGAADAIDQAAQRWREAIDDGKPGEAMALELARRVWAPLDTSCAQASLVLLAPDGELSQIPWGALPDLDANARRGAYLLERCALAQLGSARQLVDRKSDAAEPGGNGLLVIGGVDYNRREPLPSPTPRAPEQAGQSIPKGPAFPSFPALPGTAAEVDDVQTFFARSAVGGGKVTTLVGAQASKDRVLDALAGKRYLHLATHGFFAPPQLLDALAIEDRQPYKRPPTALRRLDAVAYYPGVLSGLVCAGANAPGIIPNPFQRSLDWGGNVLTAVEVGGLDLSGCELAVLSACETGVGRLAAGEGVLGLMRAFHVAGARSVIGSLWRVNDAATCVLMREFYTNLWVKKQPKLEALRAAQLTVLNRPDLVEQYREELAGRGIGPTPEKLPDGGRRVAPPSTQGGRSSPALWAAFVFSGDVN
jgi:CHAT domain-containing protein/tetratricopeptide (TPR) repeat protein